MVDVNDIKERLLLEALQGLRERIDRLEKERSLAQSGAAILTNKCAQAIVNSSLDIIIAVDKDRKIIEFNRSAEEAFGYSREEVIGKHVDILYSDPDEALRISQVVRSEGKFYGEVKNKRKNGETFLCLLSSSTLYDENGNFMGTMGISRDITEQKKTEEELRRYREQLEELVQERTQRLANTNRKLAEEIRNRKQVENALREEKERLDATLRSIADGVIAVDIEGKITLANQSAKVLTEHDCELIGKQIKDVFCIMKQGSPSMEWFDEVLRTRSEMSIENATLLTKKGAERYVSGSIAPIHDEEGLKGMVVVFRDVTEKKKMEEELLRIQKLESISVLAGGLAHDFNNFLTVVLGSISVVKKDLSPGSPAFKNIESAEKACLRARDVTTQLLSLSRGGSPILRPSSVIDLVKDTTDFALRGSNVTYELEIRDDIWTVNIDEGQISQVISNIVINAQQAMPNGGTIKISIENISIPPSKVASLKGDYVKISITDQGIGIPQENLNKIFDPYFTTKPHGTGLGLATAYSIVRNHGGYIDVESKVGKGSTFFIYLPAVRTQATSVDRQEEDNILAYTGSVLVMDDEELIREVTTEMLTSIGCKVTVAKDGNEAIDLFVKARESGDPFDVVILDLTVPGGVGGKDAVRRMLEIDRDIRAIATSGYINDPLIVNHRDYGFKSALAKPYTLKDLIDALNKCK